MEVLIRTMLQSLRPRDADSVKPKSRSAEASCSPATMTVANFNCSFFRRSSKAAQRPGTSSLVEPRPSW